MADMSQAPLNGSYPAQHAYPDSFNHTHATMNTAANFQPAQSSTPTTNTPTDHKSDIPKDEVGWFFVEQYYTTMSSNPDKLHLFYSRRSQLVFGTEAESVPVAIGTKAINDKIKQLDFQECKVRVLNVDSQASFDNILVTVIGEISNKSEPSRKFIQTFVLAQQPNGYYVLNDIFRYLVEEEDEIVEEAEATPAVEAPKVAEPAPVVEEAQVTDEAAATKVDEKLEEETNGEAEKPVEVVPEINGTATEEVSAPAVQEAVEEEPLAPEPTPAPVPAKEAPVEKKEPVAATPAVPKSWASIAKANAAAAAASAAPAAAATPAAATPAAAAPKAAAPAASVPQPASAAAPAAEARTQEAAPTDGSGWQTAGSDHKKTQSRAGEQQTTLGYIKNVTDKVDANALKQTLSRFGKLNYFDVSRQKNCAFVEFAEPSGYAAAVAANPHQVGSEQILLEERRPRGNAYGSNGANRGPAGRGRGDRTGNQGRGGFQREGRGGFAPRGRGANGNVAAKGRSQAQAA
ncbi:hypothetical protein N7481_000485 [Penicillium waksmanii]|uniref:uncharacterized protein n=1 Tax=Penicillium waksmanii TaxID=69791 RepID=UPI002547FC40|nr:uncharacterized protein N7481_000485 [Penicillium waksmanii]KAJ6000076.1 hypothetical protein N7481_000485 [Penicillium waksmanii]